MQSCASPGPYFEVSPTQGVSEPMNALEDGGGSASEQVNEGRRAAWTFFGKKAKSAFHVSTMPSGTPGAARRPCGRPR
jgi:hypothetical protein